MEPPKGVSYKNIRLLRLLLLVTFILNYSAGAQSKKHETSESVNSFKKHQQTQGSLSSVNRVRKRRETNVTKLQCFNEMAFPNRGRECFYDRACFTIFSDCCPNYEKHCGPQEVHEPKTSVWKCVDWNYDPICSIQGVTGVWMVYKCPTDWFVEESRSRCENAPPKFSLQFSYPIEDHIPVLGTNGYTFRNEFCALCNGMENYTAWNLGVSSPVLPPEGLNLNSKLKFIEKNGGAIDEISLTNEQPTRVCYGRNYIANCSLTNDTSYKACVKGPVGIVNSKELYFKNAACGKCNGYPGLTGIHYSAICGETHSESFSLVFNFKNTGEKVTTSTVVSKNCPLGTVYDTHLKFCRKGYLVFSSGKLINEFLLLLWLKQPELKLIQQESYLKLALIFQYSLQPSQISTVTMHRQYSWNDYVVASFRLTLTPFQSLVMTNQHRANLNFTSKQSAFLQLLNFTGNFTIVGKNYSFSVVNVISKQLSCYGKRTFQVQEYEIMNKTNKLVIKETGEVLSLNDFTLRKQGDGNITLCRKLVLSDCVEGAYVPLNATEYIIFPNLSVYHNATKTVFKFGDYLISENSSKEDSNDSNTTENSILSRSSSISVCLPFTDTYKITKTSMASSNGGLRILTIIGFSISIICLALLLITYGSFQELRTVPGKNLMNLGFALLLSQLMWLIGTAFLKEGTACKVFAILEHYLLLVSFVAMSVMSYHTCHVFSKPFAGSIANTSSRRFIKYSAFVWITPAIFVSICVALDETEAFIVDYGTNCWLGTANAKLYLFLLPLALLLLYNIYAFIKTAVSLSRHERERKTLHQKEGRQNLLICTKLATLVGFPWLFAFFGVLFPDIEAFEYLFVVFVCLQGLYIGMAFLFNKKTWKLYGDRFNISLRASTRSYATTSTFELT